MSEQYNTEISKHYAAYRPPIHQMILNANLSSLPSFHVGVDVGCGTGVSTVALSEYCQTVRGVDPSESMIGQTLGTDRISYSVGTGENIPAENGSVDIITFAGSLSYAKSEALVEEIKRVCAKNATVLVYDFEVLLMDFMDMLGIAMNPVPSDYDHAINFSDIAGFHPANIHQGTLSLEVTSEQLAHVLFSSSTRYTKLVKAFGEENTFNEVVRKLTEISPTHRISVNTYSSMYNVNRD
ncbi:class I SAM-dependent methyltransferase [Parasalinivibrio latis]